MKKKHNRGFTLVELAFVVLLLATLGLILFGTVNGLIRSRRMILEAREGRKVAERVFTQMTRELENHVSVPLLRADITQDTDPKAPETFDALFLFGQHRDVPFRSIITNGSADSIRFVSRGTGLDLGGGVRTSGDIEVEYRLEEISDPQALSLLPKRTWVEKNQNSRWVLVREEIPSGTRNIKFLKERRVVIPISDAVVSFQVRYRHKKKWSVNWEGELDDFPDLVEIELGIRTERTIEFYKTAVALQREILD